MVVQFRAWLLNWTVSQFFFQNDFVGLSMGLEFSNFVESKGYPFTFEWPA